MIWAAARLAAIVVLALVATGAKAALVEYADNPPPLLDRLTPEVLDRVYPDGADRLEFVDGAVPAVAVYEGEAVAAYIFSTLDLLNSRGFSSTAFDVIAGVDLEGRITGVTDVFHREPHIFGDPRRTDRLESYLRAFAGVLYTQRAAMTRQPDFVSGATISARAMAYAVTDGARMVMRNLVGVAEVTEPTIDVDGFAARTLDELLAAGSVRTLSITNAELDAAFAAAGAPGATAAVRPLGEPEEVYIAFFAALATPAMISRNLGTSAGALDRLSTGFPAGSHGIIVGSRGRYDYQGFTYQNASSGYRLERIEIRQGDNTWEFHRNDYFRAPTVFGSYGGVLVIPPDAGFAPMAPFTVVLKVHGTSAEGAPVTAAFPLDYVLPAEHILLPEPPPEPLWVSVWRDARGDLAILGAALLVLTLIFVFQAQLSRHRRLHRAVRLGFLAFTVVWLGYIAGGQFSITHVVNWLRGPFENVDLNYYLVEPIVVCLAIYVAISLVLIGRGVFCGWLCPFGALQEFAHRIGRLLRLPVWDPPARLQRAMWLPKYGAAALIIGTAFLLPEWTTSVQEIEPFKTAITSGFSRQWPFVAYAVLLLTLSLFTERAFCRFLCPLGGFLAVLDRLHVLNLLKRRPECGSPCQLCSRSCPVRAITPSGRIVMAECFQCLDCQVEYYDDRRCPPLAQQRKARGRAAHTGAIAAPGLGPVPAFTFSGPPSSAGTSRGRSGTGAAGSFST